MDAYELNMKNSKYKLMRENVIKIINVFSSNNVLDNLSMAESSLKNNYLVNNMPCKANEIKNIRDNISNDINILRNILSAVDSNLATISNNIKKLGN